jgi:hypothetical protein
MVSSSVKVATTVEAPDITGSDSTTVETGKTSHVTSFGVVISPLYKTTLKL